MAPKSKESTPDVNKVIVDLSTQDFSGKKIGELLDIKPRTVQNFLKMFLEVTGNKDAQGGIPAPYSVLFGATAVQL